MNLIYVCQCGQPLTPIAIEINRLKTLSVTLLRCQACMAAADQQGDEAHVLAPDDTTALLTRCANVVIGLIDWNRYLGQFDAPI